MPKPKLSDFIANERKDVLFAERARKFEEQVKLLSEEWGVVPAAVLQSAQNSLVAVPAMQDLWEKASSTESEPSGK